MLNAIAAIIERTLRVIGVKSLNAQFLLSYGLIFLLAVASGVSLYLSMAINPQTINMAGRQRMLSQKIAKEAILVASQSENRATLTKTMQLFEQSHKSIVNGSSAQGMNPITSPVILKQMQQVNSLWLSYKEVINSYTESPTAAMSREIQSQSLTLLKEMNKAVSMMTQEANSTTRTQLIIAFI